MGAAPLPAELPPLPAAFVALLHGIAPDTPPSLLAAAALLVALDAQGHTAMPLDEPAAALAESGWPLPVQQALAPALPRSAAAARTAWAGSPLLTLEPALHGPDTVATPLVQHGRWLALRRHWQDESRAAAALRARLRSPVVDAQASAALPGWLDRLFPPLAADGVDPQREAALGADMQREAALGADMQREAALRALQSRLLLITGGPGTGKTWTAARVLLLLQAQAGATPLRLALAAPTGKAAARLQEAIAQALHSLARIEDSSTLHAARLALARAVAAQPARTLHSTLGVHPHSRRFRHHAGHPLAADLLLVDEASMVHAELLAALLDALPAHARLLLLGDRDQLASVEAGAVMAELTSADSVLAPQTVRLHTGHRFSGPLAALAAAVNAGDASAAEAAVQRAASVVTVLATRTPEALLQLSLGDSAYGPLLQQLQSRPAAFADDAAFFAWLGRVFDCFESFRVLTALREGPWGSVALNQRLAQALLGWGAGPALAGGEAVHPEGQALLITRNDPALGVFNGDVGLALTPREGGARRLWLRDGAAWRSVAVVRLAAVQPAWAMTVHKSQGSEFAHVALVLPEQPTTVLTREWLYTGITRARAQLTLALPQAARFGDALAARTRRFSALGDALRESGG